MPGKIEAIYIAPNHGSGKTAVDEIKASAGVGLDGDRYAGSDGGVVSLIEAEEVERFNRDTGLDISAADTGRNVVTRGVRLNPFEGGHVRVGEIEGHCFELCEPCASLADKLSTDAVPPAQVLKAFVHAAGIRIRLTKGGTIRVGDDVEAARQ